MTARLTTFRVAERRLTELWVMARANDMVVVVLVIYVSWCVAIQYSFDGMIRRWSVGATGFEWRNDLEVLRSRCDEVTREGSRKG